jgi:hypothetical protein
MAAALDDEEEPSGAVGALGGSPAPGMGKKMAAK